MRFLFELVSCCASPVHRSPEPVLPPPEDERSLVPAPSRRRNKQRMGAPDWRPSLGPISEDSAPPPIERDTPRNAAVASSRRDVKKRSAAAGGGAAKVRHRSYSDAYHGSASMPTIVPTFSPTPFMF